MHLWYRLLPQAVMTLNMLRTSRINPKLLAATHIFGQYDFNRAPMATQEQESWHMKHQAEEELGHHMGNMAGTLVQH
jgi:mannose-6-phosphate isomerase-like protein (cupin superfamily)